MYILVNKRNAAFGGLTPDAEEHFSNIDDCIVKLEIYNMREEAEEHRGYLSEDTEVTTLEAWLHYAETKVPLMFHVEKVLLKHIVKNCGLDHPLYSMREDLTPIWFDLIFDSVLDTAEELGLDSTDVPVGTMCQTHNTGRKIVDLLHYLLVEKGSKDGKILMG